MMDLEQLLDSLPVVHRRAARDALSHACVQGSLCPNWPRVLVLKSVSPPVLADRWVSQLVRVLGAESAMDAYAGREVTPAMIEEWTPLQVLHLVQHDPQMIVPLIRDLARLIWRGGQGGHG